MQVPTQTREHQWSRMVVTPVDVLAGEGGENTGLVLETGPDQVVIGCFNCDVSIEEGFGTSCIDAGGGD